MATSLSVRPNRTIIGSDPAGSARPTLIRRRPISAHLPKIPNSDSSWRRLAFASHRRKLDTAVQAGSRADDSAPFEMSVENALKLLGVAEGASFDDILRAKKSIISSCKDDADTIAQVYEFILLIFSSITAELLFSKYLLLIISCFPAYRLYFVHLELHSSV